MYEVMARRYRPALFEEVVGQEHIAATLKNAITRDRVAHAYIFTGGHGCGKTTMARILAKALVCEKGPTPEPCCVCPICVDVAAGRDSDVLEIDGASNNGIEQIRLLREQASYVPVRARYKIYIIDEVHMLSDGAFNALLKTLEEPPRHVKFILATTDPHKVPDTILSRCQRFDFRLVPQPKLAAFFRTLAGQEKAAITDDALDAVAAFAEGSVRDGLVLLDQLLSFSDGEVRREDVESVRGVASSENVAGLYGHIASGNPANALAVVDEVASRGTNVGDFLDQLISFGRDLMVLIASGNEEVIAAYGPARETLLRLAGTTDLETALLYLDVFTQARTRVRSRALSNPLVALEMAVARLAGLVGVTPVTELLGQLAQIHVAGGSLPAAAKEVAKVAVASIPTPQPAPQPAPQPVAMTVPQPAVTEPPAEPTLKKTETEAVEQKAETEPTRETGGELTRENADKAWSKILDALAEKHPADFRHILRMNIESVGDGEIVLGGPATVVEMWEDRLRLRRLTECAEEILGTPVRFSFVGRVAKRESRREVVRQRSELTRHPSVEKVRSLFEGVIVDCQMSEPTAPPSDAGGEYSDDDEENA